MVYAHDEIKKVLFEMFWNAAPSVYATRRSLRQKHSAPTLLRRYFQHWKMQLDVVYHRLVALQHLHFQRWPNFHLPAYIHDKNFIFSDSCGAIS
jgi:hypothetical protein